jgi:oligoribonuclease (3'-5' exoribonuclease)
LICWLDIETTGLDPNGGLILELAMALAKDEAPTEIVARGEWVISAGLDAYDLADDFVKNMHSENNLWCDCADSYFSQEDVEEAAISLLAGESDLTIAGASIGNFDLQWLKVHMPQLASCFSHRVLDTSSVRRYLDHCGAAIDWPRGEQHRAMADVNEAIEHYRLALEWGSLPKET